MSGNAETSARGGTRGRGRGGGRGARPPSTQRGGAASAVTAKIGPTRVLQLEWVKENVLKDKSFVFWLGTGVAGDQQWTFHRPIGESPLTSRQWVATPTRDVSFLLMRKENEALASWKRKGELAKRADVLRRGEGRRVDTDGETEVWTFDGAPAIGPTIRTCISAAKAAGAKESEWLTYADPAVQVAERQFKQALRLAKVPEIWLLSNKKPEYETKGGALGDVPQKAVGYLNGLTLSAARDKVTRVAVGLDKTDDLPVPDDEEDEESDEEDEVTHTEKNHSGQKLGSGTQSPVKPGNGKGSGSSTGTKSPTKVNPGKG